MKNRTLAALTLMVTLLFGSAQAQSFNTAVGPMFDDLVAEELSCATLGLNSGDINRCGMIDDNLVDINKRIISRHVRDRGMTVLLPWRVMYLDNGMPNHQLGFMGSDGWRYIMSYVEFGPNSSFVWLMGDR